MILFIFFVSSILVYKSNIKETLKLKVSNAVLKKYLSRFIHVECIVTLHSPRDESSSSVYSISVGNLIQRRSEPSPLWPARLEAILRRPN